MPLFIECNPNKMILRANRPIWFNDQICDTVRALRPCHHVDPHCRRSVLAALACPRHLPILALLLSGIVAGALLAEHMLVTFTLL